MGDSLSRRDVLRIGIAGLVAGAAAEHAGAVADEVPPLADQAPSRPFLTSAKDFTDVSRGRPIPHTLTGDDLIKARLTPETWRLEIVAEEGASVEKPMTLEANTALDFQALVKLGEAHGVPFLKAMQCNNLSVPLGQGLWEGVPLREVLKLCGKLYNPRRLFYWGFHNDAPEQMFRSSLAMNQVFDTPPGELPVFIAYKLNGGPIPLVRGGPARMVVPWAHGFKSVKWLQKIVLTNHYDANDTYALQNNDPESNLKTAAYFDDLKPANFAAGEPLLIRGTAMVGLPGLEKIEYWLRPGESADPLADDDPAWNAAEWKPVNLDPLPGDWCSALPGGATPKDLWGFDRTGKPKEWPRRYSIAHWSLTLKDVKPGKHELRVRTVDKNGFAQPQPRPLPKSGRNQIQCKVIEIQQSA